METQPEPQKPEARTEKKLMMLTIPLSIQKNDKNLVFIGDLQNESNKNPICNCQQMAFSTRIDGFVRRVLIPRVCVDAILVVAASFSVDSTTINLTGEP